MKPASGKRIPLAIGAGVVLTIGIGFAAFGGDNKTSGHDAREAKDTKEALILPSSGTRKEVRAPAMKTVFPASLGMPFGLVVRAAIAAGASPDSLLEFFPKPNTRWVRVEETLNSQAFLHECELELTGVSA